MAKSDDTATFAIDLNPEGAKQGAEQAASSLENLQGKIDEDTAALGNMQKALRAMKGSTLEASSTFKGLKDRIEAQKATIAQNQAKFVNLGGSFSKIKKPSEEAGNSIKAMIEKMQKGGGPVGSFAGKLGGMRSMLVSGGLAAGTVAVAAAVIALAAAVTIATLALLKYGIASADARRSEALSLEGLTKVRNWYGIAAGKASDLQTAIDNVSNSASSGDLGREQVNGLARGLYTAGLRGKNLEEALGGLATVTSAAGEGQAAFYKGMIMAQGRLGGSVKKVTDDIKARFGEIAARQSLGIGNQIKRLKQNFDILFSGLKIEKLLESFHVIADLFSQTSESGKALKLILEAVLQPLIDTASGGTPTIKKFFQLLIIAGQDLTIMYLNVRLAWRQAFGGEHNKKLDSMKIALVAVSVVCGVLFAAAAGVGIVFGVIAAGAVAVVGSLMTIIGPVIAIILSFRKVEGAGQRLGAWLKNQNWFQYGLDLVLGFAKGILGGIPLAVAATLKLGKATIEAMKKALDSHSPSRKFELVADTGPQGIVRSFRRGMPLVHATARNMGDAAVNGFRARRFGADLSAGAGVGASIRIGNAPKVEPRSPSFDFKPPGGAPQTVTIGEVKIVTQATDAKAMMRDIKPELVKVFTEVAISVGARGTGAKAAP